MEGVPRGATRLQLDATPGGGFAEPGGRLGKVRALELDAALVCCHGGPGEDGTLQAALDLAGIRYSGPTVAGAALGMDKLAFGAVVAAAGLPTLPRVLLSARGTAAAVRRALHRQAPVRRVVHRHRRGGGRGHRHGPAPGQPASPVRRGGGALPARPHRPAAGRAQLALAAALGRGTADPGLGRRRHPRLPGQVRGRRGDGRRQPRAAGPDPRRAGEGAAARRRDGGRPDRRPRRGPHRLPVRRRALRGQRDQHHPRLAGPLPVGGSGGAVRHPARTTCWTRPVSAPPTPTRPPGADGTVLRTAGSIAGKLG